MSEDLIQGETYTLSYDSTSLVVTEAYPQFYIWKLNDWASVQSVGTIAAKTRTFVWNKPTGRYTFTVYSHNYPQGGTFNKLKLEKGNMATPWTASNADLQADTVNEVKAGLTITPEGIDVFGETFKVNSNMIAKAIQADSLDVGSGNFHVAQDGIITAKGANIEGKISSNAKGNRITIDPNSRALYLQSASEKLVGAWSFGNDFSYLSIWDRTSDVQNNEIAINGNSVALQTKIGTGFILNILGLWLNVDLLPKKGNLNSISKGQVYLDGDTLKIKTTD